MAKSNKITYSADDFDWIYPSRPLHLLERRHEIDRIIKSYVDIPGAAFTPEIAENPEGFIIVEFDGRIAGIVHLEVHKQSVEAHIVVIPEFQRSNLTQLLSHHAIRLAFLKYDKPKMFCDIGIANRRAQALAASLGFTRIAVYNKRIKYKLKRNEYLGQMSQGSAGTE